MALAAVKYEAPNPQPKPYLVSPPYDWAFFLLPPTVALLLGILIAGTGFTENHLQFAGTETTLAGLFLGVIVHAHLVAVFFRSHGNPKIYRLYPLRFLWIPLALWVALLASAWLAVIATVVATFWDVYHSGAQTFGFARIYDRNAGAPPEVGRRLDFWLNQLLYAGPIIAGVTLIDHLEDFEGFASLGTALFYTVPADVMGWQRYLAWGVLVGGGIFLIYYVYRYWQLYRQGYPISRHKLFLVISTGACSIYTWGFNSWGEAFFIMNLFHAVQYLALVWATEGTRLHRSSRLAKLRNGKQLALISFLGIVFAYGFMAEVISEHLHLLWATTMVVSLMHFWYDGFIWSVRKAKV